ncbi:carboxypeptidase regulatory-like domain-containing protein [Desertibacillus haloalkaliphilus]|uniref:carboxypeptidase regulatory-like domain-containing protein n=1 Tax=Desertibacillus haloalkaliphilus TaxID=1328930 RepID=UPI001C27E8FB|nr:carboxypeptidase regulatory-like domain-containing protein [Desertibacillus haloalkaliphilus]MBU8905962.1 carboxypeptidase regulatory-like domain-containing protein [Desertibacillus haloalkaliphilus]
MGYQPKNFRKFLATSVSAAVVATVAAPMGAVQVAAAENPFSDVVEGTYYYDAVTKMAEAGFINGIGNGQFGTNLELKRGDAAVLFANSLLWDTDNVSDNPFTDVENIYYHNAIVKAQELGVINGRTATTFAPQDSLTRGEMAALLTRAFDLEADLTQSVPFTDIENEYFKEDIIAVYQAGLTEGATATTFNPKGTVTRAQFATFLYRHATVQENVEAQINVETPEITSFNAIANDDQTIVVNGAATDAERVEVSLDGENFVEAELDEEGNFTFTSDQLDPGVYSVSAIAYNGEVASEVATEDVTIVSAETGVAGFVSLSGSGDVDGITVSVDGKEAKTNKDGYFAIEGITAGEHTVTVSKTGYETEELTVNVIEDKASAIFVELTALAKADIEINATVVDSQSAAPVVNADVVLERYDEDEDEWVAVDLNDAAETNSNGQIVIANNAETNANGALNYGDELRLQVSKDYNDGNLDGAYHATDWIEFSLPKDRNVTTVLDGIEMDAVEALTIDGTVLNAEEDAVASQTVQLFDQGGENLLANVDTNAEGEFEFDGLTLPSGTYFVKVDTGSAEDAIYTAELEVVEGQDVTADINLEAGFDVDVTIGAAGVANELKADDTYKAQIVSNGVVVAEDEAEIALDGDARSLGFNFDRIPSGDYTVRVSGDYILPTEFTVTVDGDDATAEGNVTTAGVIEGSISGVSEDALVSLVDADGEVVDTVETTDAYKFASVAAGDYTVEVSKAGFESKASDEFTVEAKQQVTGVDFTLEAIEEVTSATISGYVRTEGSLNPAAGASLSFYAIAVEDEEPGAYVDSVAVESNGSYSKELEEGTYQVVVRDGGNHETFMTTLNVTADRDRENVNYTLEAGGEASLELTLVDEDGEELDPTNITFDTLALYDSEADASDESTDPALTVNSADVTEETITFADLSAGTYTLVLEADGYNDVSRSVEVTKNDDATLEISFTEVVEAEEHSVSLRAIHADNNANFDGATVLAFDKDGEVAARTTTDASGEAALSLVDGAYTIAVIADGYVVSKQTVTVDGDDVTAALVQLAQY